MDLEQEKNYNDFIAILNEATVRCSLGRCLDQLFALCCLSKDRIAYVRGDTDFAKLSEAATSILREYLAKVLAAFQHKPHTPLKIFPDQYSDLVEDSTNSCAILGVMAIEYRLISLSLALIDLFYALKAEAVLIRAAWRGWA